MRVRMMRKSWYQGIIMVIVLMAWSPGIYAAERVVGTIASLEGPATVESGKISKVAAVRMTLFSGDVLRTSTGKVEITCPSGNRVKIYPHTLVAFNNPPKSNIQQVQLLSGRLWYKASMDENIKMVLVTKNASANLGFSEGEGEFRPQQDTCILKVSLGRTVVSALCGNKEVKELFGGQEISLVGCQFSALRGGGTQAQREGAGGASILSSSSGGAARTGAGSMSAAGGGSKLPGGGFSLSPSQPNTFGQRPPASPWRP